MFQPRPHRLTPRGWLYSKLQRLRGFPFESFARELARAHPDRVRAVVTLGSPFSGNPKLNNVWRLYEWVAGHPVDAPPIDRIPDKPPVPTLAIWSRADGIVAPAAANAEPNRSELASALGTITRPPGRTSRYSPIGISTSPPISPALTRSPSSGTASRVVQSGNVAEIGIARATPIRCSARK